MKVTNGCDRFRRPYVEKKSAVSLIRLQNYVDEDIPSDRTQLWSKILEARNTLLANVDGIVDLYSRSWEPSSQQHCVDVEESGAKDDNSSSCFTVAQFNTLARGLSSGANNIFPTPFETDSELHDGSYGGFTELTKPELILDFDRLRKWRLLEVLLGGGDAFDTESPAFDILALEEVDEYHSFFEPILVKDGCYCGIYQPKPYSPCVRFGWYSDGVALLWKTEKFKVIDECIDANGNSMTLVTKGSFEDGAECQNQVYIIVPLQVKGTDKCIVVAATHLKAKKGETNEQIRQSQALQIRRRSEQMADQLKELGWTEVNILILGDFNAEPDSASVGSILGGKGDWKFRSTTNDNDDSYTTWKTRKSGTTRRVIDYIFHTSKDGMQCKEVLSIPSNEVLERTFLPGFRYPSDHLLVAAKFHLGVNRQFDPLPDASSSPFEWLTNFQSLRHLVLPSYIVGGVSPPIGSASDKLSLKLNALHVGCGTSTVGESLLCLREKDTNGNQLQYGHVVNVDIDKDALRVMQHRWRQRELQTQQLDGITLGVMDWRYLDFKSEESCRLALDPLYNNLLQASPCNPNNELGGYFDLVLDKSTLDCLLCSETDVVSVFLCEVYRALKVPTLESECSPDVDCKHTPGGVYVLVTFHPIDFIQELLAELPGAHLEIEYEVIERKADIVNTIDAVKVEEVVSGKNQSECDPETCLKPPSSAWISGSFCPDENYRKTITVFTCRRLLNPNEEGSNQTFALNRQLVREHIENTCDKWYRTTSPMVTNEREAKLRQDFQNACLSKQDESSLKGEVALDLKTCYDLMFTEEEKQVLPYDYFIEDWDAYCQNLRRGEDFPRQVMTINTAIDFLKEMQ